MRIEDIHSHKNRLQISNLLFRLLCYISYLNRYWGKAMQVTMLQNNYFNHGRSHSQRLFHTSKVPYPESIVSPKYFCFTGSETSLEMKLLNHLIYWYTYMSVCYRGLSIPEGGKAFRRPFWQWMQAARLLTFTCTSQGPNLTSNLTTLYKHLHTAQHRKVGSSWAHMI